MSGPVPVLLVTGFLGAGKTTLINRLLHANHGERIAAVVNDFGAINIDAALLEEAADTVIGLQNGCICCSLQGDLLRTLKLLLARNPRPERLIIEASGVADPRGIIEALTDAVLWNAVRLDAVACVIDAAALAENPALHQDPLWQAQWRASDFVLLSKGEGAEVASAPFRLAGKTVFNGNDDELPLPALFGRMPERAAPGPERVTADRFVTLEWQSPTALPLDGFRKALSAMSAGLLRAKGYLDFQERPGVAHLLQMVGRRVSLSAATRPSSGCQLVLIGERGTFDPQQAREALDALASSNLASTS